MSLQYDLRTIHLPNLFLFGILPTLVLYSVSDDFKDFISRIECLRTADPLVIYYLLLFLFPLALYWSSWWVKVVSPQWRAFLRSAEASLRSIYYVVSGICFTTGGILSSKVSNLEDFSVVVLAVFAGVIFLSGAIYIMKLLPETLKYDYF